MQKILVGFVLYGVLTGCVSQTFTKVESIAPDAEICIVMNFQVLPVFADAYKASIEDRGYSARLIQPEDDSCPITSTYAASYGNHWGPYLRTADLQIFRNSELIGRALYRAPRADMSKHGKISNKLDKLVNELLPLGTVRKGTDRN